MSKAVNTNDPKYSRLTIGVCPDQWGVWFPEDPRQMDPRQAWEEMAEAASRSSRPAPSATSRPTPRSSRSGATSSA